MLFFLHKHLFFLGTKYLRFFLDIKIVGENKKAMDNKIKENFFNYLNEEYFKHFTCWSEQIEELRFKNRKNTLLFNDFKEIYRLVYSQLNIYFKDYQKTVSYLLLKRSLRENDLVNARLYSYNILTKLE